MASVYLLSTSPQEDDGLDRLLKSAREDPFGDHTLTDRPDQADLILFVESWEANWQLDTARHHSLTQQYREKTFVVCEQDLAFHALPGVYTNVGRASAATGRVRQGCYLWMYDNPFVTDSAYAPEDMHLYTFVGSLTTDPIRQALATLHHPRGNVRDTSAQSEHVWWHADAAVKEDFQKKYAETLQRSKFVLCPRGISPSTVRLFETMKTGRVPVIISDDWIPPDGPDWDSFSIRVPEDKVSTIPALLEEYESDAPQMGARAREAWETWFSPPVQFHRIVEWCLDIQSTRRLPERIGRYLAYVQLVTTPVLLRKWVKDRYTDLRPASE